MIATFHTERVSGVCRSHIPRSTAFSPTFLALSMLCRWCLRCSIFISWPCQEKALQKENDVLTRNISCLFNTAREEIARKEKWIKQLREEVGDLERMLKEHDIHR